jgi:hypothetical protein
MASAQMTYITRPIQEGAMDISDAVDADAAGSAGDDVERGRRRTSRKLVKKRKERESWSSSK